MDKPKIQPFISTSSAIHHFRSPLAASLIVRKSIGIILFLGRTHLFPFSLPYLVPPDVIALRRQDEGDVKRGYGDEDLVAAMMC